MPEDVNDASAHGVVSYEYRGLMATTWDELRGDPSGRDDRDFYLAMIRAYGEPVLDVGCGTGRLLLDLLGAGIDIDGLDVSPEMLAICEQKGVRLGLSPRTYAQRVETMTLLRHYSTILASSSVLQLITQRDAVEHAMQRLYAHLGAGGVLVAPFMTLWRDGMPQQREWENARVRAEDGALLQRMGRVWFDTHDECEHTEDLYQVIVDGKVVAVEHHRRSPASRSYTQAQACQLFVDAGFVDLRVVRAFTTQMAYEEDLFFTIIGRKA